MVVVAPYAVHGAVLADLAPRHDLIARLLAEGLTRVVLVEWKSATPAMRFLRIDEYLSLLLLVVEELGAPSTLVGLCQGGWMSLMFAARFPEKVSALVLAGAPVDLDAAPSKLVMATRDAAPETLERLVQDDGLVSGPLLLSLWGKHDLEATAIADACRSMRGPGLISDFRLGTRSEHFASPTAFGRQRTFFRKTCAGGILALGRRSELAAVRTPRFRSTGQVPRIRPAQVLRAQVPAWWQ